MPKKTTRSGTRSEAKLLTLLDDAIGMLKSIAVSLDSVAQSLHEQSGKTGRAPVVKHIGTATYARPKEESEAEVPGFRRS